jgi:rare lipoprotein A
MEKFLLTLVLIGSVYSHVIVSWYGQNVCQDKKICKTASGDVFNENNLTVANKTLKFGTLIEFKYKDKKVICRVNDRGPYIKGRDFDLSRGCAEKLGIISKGVAEVEYRTTDNSRL